MSVIKPESGIDKKVSIVAIFLRWGEASRKCMNKGCIDVRVPQSYYIKKKEVLIVLSFVGFWRTRLVPVWRCHYTTSGQTYEALVGNEFLNST